MQSLTFTILKPALVKKVIFEFFQQYKFWHYKIIKKTKVVVKKIISQIRIKIPKISGENSRSDASRFEYM